MITPLKARTEALVSQIDGAFRASMEAAFAHLRRSGLETGAKEVGDHAPHFALPDPTGEMVSLGERLRAGPVVLSFFRGEWCPFCRVEMEALLAAMPDLTAAGASLMMISPQDFSETLVARSRDVPGLTVLKDPVNGVGLQYGLVFRMPDVQREALLARGVDLSQVYGTDAWLLPIPATYVIRPDGTIALCHKDPDYTRRLDPTEIVASLRGPTAII
ncbi:peroxiredoxin-like family protein [Methylobacterium aquaticum]|uniref:thioredoxin-dependent peroxiredoxin n=1 Tax=Methylobacterium aquaticum TaxID=270351 RepID=A0A0J6UMW2_9HYPH|nr:peroxiredoxin-like family protein [Methylobacterium aquaticum]KMO27361.1 alkyl hydroperoxide reductase [Methylobacterium aquaticum]